MKSSIAAPTVARYADMLAALGAEPRLRVMRLLLAAHPDGMVVGDLQAELDIPGPTLSHHLEKLRQEGLVAVRREQRFQRYTANGEALREILAFLFEECCGRGGAVRPETIVKRRR
jgi:DNA-binding transcriptional ArsR family regulator